VRRFSGVGGSEADRGDELRRRSNQATEGGGSLRRLSHWGKWPRAQLRCLSQVPPTEKNTPGHSRALGSS